jgi:hypothetical protein
MRPLLFFLAMLSLLAALFTTCGAKTSGRSKRAARPIIEFGHKGGNLRPYTIAIDEGGRVRVLAGAPPLKTHRIPAGKVQEIVNKARDDSFWKTGQTEAEQKPTLPDFGSVFIKVRVPGHTSRVIRREGAQVGPLGEFYQMLSDFVLATP